MMTTRKRLLELFDVDTATGILTWKVRRGPMRAGAVAGSDNGNGHLQTKIDGRLYMNHRLIWLAYYGRWPAGEIDHINGMRADNRIVNLRDVNRQENMRNAARHSRNTSGVTGVYWKKPNGKWGAQITVDGKHRHLGYFNDIHAAAAVRKAAEKEHGFHPNHGRIAEQKS